MELTGVRVRAETKSDYDAVHKVHNAAFATDAEAKLVDALREEAEPVISLVAEVDGLIVGHILFSPVSLLQSPNLKIMGLAPMAVIPGCQRRGIGATLVHAGLEQCRHDGFGAVVVLGHPRYYPRFGFEVAARFGIVGEYDVPDEAFMIMELEPDYLEGVSGVLRYHPAFAMV